MSFLIKTMFPTLTQQILQKISLKIKDNVFTQYYSGRLGQGGEHTFILLFTLEVLTAFCKLKKWAKTINMELKFK